MIRDTVVNFRKAFTKVTETQLVSYLNLESIAEKII